MYFRYLLSHLSQCNKNLDVRARGSAAGRFAREPLAHGATSTATGRSPQIVRRIVAEAKALREIGIGTIAIMPNDTDAYPEDSFDNMKTFAARHGFRFPYVIDTTQEVARAYDVQSTPDFFGFNAQDELQYRGRMPRAPHWSPMLVVICSRR